jgi:hypothetical protein
VGFFGVFLGWGCYRGKGKFFGSGKGFVGFWGGVVGGAGVWVGVVEGRGFGILWGGILKILIGQLDIWIWELNVFWLGGKGIFLFYWRILN